MARRKQTKVSSQQAAKPEIEPEEYLTITHFFLQAFYVAGTVSLANASSQLSLHPLYGAAVTSRHFRTVSLVVCLFASILPWRSSFTKATWTALSLIIPISPFALRYLGIWTAAWNNPTWGPIISQLGGSIPLQALATCILVSSLDRITRGTYGALYMKPFAGLIVWFTITRGDQVWWDALASTNVLSGCSSYVFLTLSTSLPAAIISLSEVTRLPPGSLRPRNWITQNPAGRAGLHLAIPLFISLFAQSRQPCSAPPFPYLTEGDSIRILDKQFSTTGLIVIAEFLPGPFRYMRCDHSLLGGRWLYSPDPNQPPILHESIFSAFSLQEAVRLVERPEPETSPRVLSIGLGIGVSVDSFIRHKMDTTVIEIDPVVYRYARDYFNLPEPNSVYLEDARQWVNTQVSNANSLTLADQYDFVVHDCFSGGGVPEHIFTREFWAELKLLIRPQGVLAVNFVGRFSSPAARAVLTTLLTSFGSCRVFHDYLSPVDIWGDDHFLNMVFFCSMESTITFRTPTEEDFLGSMSSQRILSTLEEREVPLERFLGNETSTDRTEWILTDEHNLLNKWQSAGAIEHFQIMQSVLPQAAWNAY